MGMAATIQTTDMDDDLYLSEEERQELSSLIVGVLRAWGLSAVEQSMVLGLSKNGRSTIHRYANGHPVAQDHDLIWRIGHLLAIHYLLRSSDIDRPDRADKWVSSPNPTIGGKRPLDLMRKPDGVAAVRAWLEVSSAW
jgi:hypothetical protein